MESGKLEIDTEVKTPNEPVATYKPIPEDDSVIATKESAKEEVNMARHDGDTDTDDGAQELMLKNSGKINSNKDASEVKFISENGDAKIDIETVKQTLTGMTKEELMKFANDPFWIRLRWFMFFTFWLLWAAMLAGAIAIIVMAPKCAAPAPRKLWQKSPIVRLNPSEIENNANGLKGLIPILDQLKKKNVKAISIGSILKSSAEGHTLDFRVIKPELGTIEDFKALVKAAQEKEQEIILEIDPNHTSMEHIWFNYSVNRTKSYTNYYVWADKKVENGQDIPPTNWRNAYGESSWEWNDERQQYYLHQFNKTQPDLNYANPDVVQEMSNILTFWMKLGVTGFRLANTQYLLEDLSAIDKTTTIEQHDVDGHQPRPNVKAHDLANNSNILQVWREVVANHTKNNGLFSLQDDVKNDMFEVFKDYSIVDLPQRSRFLFNANDSISATALQTGVIYNLPSIKDEDNPKIINKSDSWPAWDLNGPEKPLSERMNATVAESLTLMMMLLRGTPILSLDQTEYPGTAFEELAKARNQPAFLHGTTKTHVINGTVFVYTRLKSGNPAYLVAYQSGNNSAVLDLSDIHQVPEQFTIVTFSSNYVEKGVTAPNPINSNEIPISPKSTLVMQFAPKSD